MQVVSTRYIKSFKQTNRWKQSACRFGLTPHLCSHCKHAYQVNPPKVIFRDVVECSYCGKISIMDEGVLKLYIPKKVPHEIPTASVQQIVA